jgi:transcriptional regulator with PAS, ATPase and Fis domain
MLTSRQNMQNLDWIEECPAAITVCDLEGTIVAMNAKSATVFEKDGGRSLIGTSVFDCHPEPSRTKLHEILAAGKINCYTIEKNGVKKLIYQCPWREHGRLAGMVELSIEIPFELPHFIRT